MIRLRDLRDCFEGVIPSIIATVDPQGVPNISYLSHVYYVDDRHVALSNQFFSKTTANVQATGRATLLVVDGRTGAQFVLDLGFESSTTEGELFERMSAHLRAISIQHGQEKVMALRSADLYRVHGIRAVPVPAGVLEMSEALPPPAPVADRLAASASLSAALGAAADADALVDGLLDGLTGAMGFSHAMLLHADESGKRLTALASRGYDTGGAGAEIAFGQGVIGVAAERRRPVRISDMSRGRRYIAAMLSEADAEAQKVIRLPGLPDSQSQLALPLISAGHLQGVLFLEAPHRYAFTREDEDALALLAAQVAAAFRLLELDAGEAPQATAAKGTAIAQGPVLAVRYYRFDDSLFIDGAYIIKGVAGRLLLHLLQTFVREGRQDFTNREIRLDPRLRLPELKDNLETRLILLRRRLEEKDAPVRLLRPGRGLIRLEINGQPRIEIADGG